MCDNTVEPVSKKSRGGIVGGAVIQWNLSRKTLPIGLKNIAKYGLARRVDLVAGEIH